MQTTFETKFRILDESSPLVNIQRRVDNVSKTIKGLNVQVPSLKGLAARLSGPLVQVSNVKQPQEPQKRGFLDAFRRPFSAVKEIIKTNQIKETSSSTLKEKERIIEKESEKKTSRAVLTEISWLGSLGQALAFLVSIMNKISPHLKALAVVLGVGSGVYNLLRSEGDKSKEKIQRERQSQLYGVKPSRLQALERAGAAQAIPEGTISTALASIADAQNQQAMTGQSAPILQYMQMLGVRLMREGQRRSAHDLLQDTLEALGKKPLEHQKILLQTMFSGQDLAPLAQPQQLKTFRADTDEAEAYFEARNQSDDDLSMRSLGTKLENMKNAFSLNLENFKSSVIKKTASSFTVDNILSTLGSISEHSSGLQDVSVPLDAPKRPLKELKSTDIHNVQTNVSIPSVHPVPRDIRRDQTQKPLKIEFDFKNVPKGLEAEVIDKPQNVSINMGDLTNLGWASS